MTAYKLALDEPERYKGVILFAPYVMDNPISNRIGKMAVKYLLGYVVPRVGLIP